MNRREFNILSLAFATSIGLGPLKVLAQSEEDLASGYMFTDNDEFPLSEGGRPEMAVDEFGIFGSPASQLQYYKYDQVISKLSPFLESKFDMLFLANTMTTGLANDGVPFQQMQILKKKNSALPMFVRDKANVIVGVTENAELSPLIPISSGKGAPHILTYSGIFRMNHVVTKQRVGTNERWSAHMSWSSYIDFVYSTGVEARVAIHGTPEKNHHLLGKSRASEGCIRVHPTTAETIRGTLLSEAMWSDTLPEFNRRVQLPDDNLMLGSVPKRAGIKALALFFNGY